MKLNIEDRQILRTVVKAVHFKNYPKDFITDFEADKFVDALLPQTIEKLVKIGKDKKINAI